MTAPCEFASHLLHRLGIKGKPDLLEVAQQIGLRIEEVGSEGFEGSLVRALDHSKGIIAVNRSIRESTRKRFTVAHEIGHYVLPGHRKLENVCATEVVESWRQGTLRPELEANEFAVELLLPAAQVRSMLCLCEPSFEPIRRVASQFEVSLTATTFRFVELTDLPCAVVWSERKRARWYKRSQTLPLFLPKEALPSDGSFALNLFDGRRAPDDLSVVPAEAWLDREDADNVIRVLEHSILMPSYEGVLSLLWFQLSEAISESDPPTREDLDPNEFTLNRKRWPR